MDILVINGSPKGDYSCTLQTVLYWEKRFPEHRFAVVNAGQRIAALEKDFSAVKAQIEQAGMILFSYPVYTFIAPSQLHRFIRLMKTHNCDLTGKYVTQVTTSKHFYDITAHRYVQENMQDMGARFIKGLSADMDDLTTAKGQREADEFFRYALWCAKEGVFEPLPPKAAPDSHRAVSMAESVEKDERTVAIVADLAPEDTQLRDMIARFEERLPHRTRLVNIHDFAFKGGCISCFHCSTGGDCIYKDGFQTLLRENIQQCDAIVIAFSICDHSMGPVFKTYDDRQFCNGHRTVTMGKPFGYLIAGNYSVEKNLQMVVDGRAEVGGNFLAGVATDEFDPDTEIDALCARLSYALQQGYVQPANFLGVGGMKIFRDLIWLMQGMMKADHRFYKAHGQYDFPQKKRGTMVAMYAVGALMANEKLQKKMGSRMNEGMIAPYKKVVDSAVPFMNEEKNT